MDSLEYFKKSYFALDGLWFLMIEEDTSFEKALDIDKKVWKVIAKIQARIAKKQGNKFHESLKLKWESEGYKYHFEKYTVIIDQCPWWDIMKNSGRNEKAGKIGAVICPIIYNEWAREYRAPYHIKFETHMCQGDRDCRLLFQKKPIE